MLWNPSFRIFGLLVGAKEGSEELPPQGTVSRHIPKVLQQGTNTLCITLEFTKFDGSYSV